MPSGRRREHFWGISCEKSRFYDKKSFFLIAEGGVKIFGVFRVKKHDFTPKNHIFFNCGGRREILLGISCEKSRFYAKNHIFSNFRGRVPGAPLDPPLHYFFKLIQISEAVGWWSFFSIL